MHTTIARSFTFEAAHTLSWHKGKCARLHGHSYRFEIEIAGDLDDHSIIVDFDALVPFVTAHVLDIYDHRLLNDFLENPTTEHIASDIFHRLDTAWKTDGLRGILAAVTVWETVDSRATVRI